VSGVVAGLIGSVKSGAAPAPTNLVLNPSFTTDLTGWNANPETYRVTNVFRSAPASLFQSSSEFYSAQTSYLRAGILTVGQVYSLSLWIRTSYDSDFFIQLFCGANSAVITPNIALTGTFVNYKIENVLCTSNGNLTVGVGNFTDTGFWLDDVSVVLGATALVL